MPHVLINARRVHPVEAGLVRGHLFQERFEGSPYRPPGRAELPRQAEDGGVLATDLPDRPPARPGAQQRPRLGDGVVLLRQHPARAVAFAAPPRSLALGELDRSAEARRVDQPHVAPPVAAHHDATLAAALDPRGRLDVTRRKGPRRPMTSWMAVTCSPSSPTRRSQREKHKSAEQAPVDAVGSVTVEAFGSRAWSLSILRRPRPPAPQLTPASRSHPPQVRRAALAACWQSALVLADSQHVNVGRAAPARVEPLRHD